MKPLELQDYKTGELEIALREHKAWLHDELTSLAQRLQDRLPESMDLTRDTIHDLNGWFDNAMSDIKFRIEHIKHEIEQRSP